MPHMFVESKSIMQNIKPNYLAPVHQKNVQGKVSLITNTYGLIEFAQENTPESDRITTTKPDQIFFYQMDLVGTHPSEIEKGDFVQFDVAQNQKSKIYVAVNVHLISDKEPDSYEVGDTSESGETRVGGVSEYFKSFFRGYGSNV